MSLRNLFPILIVLTMYLIFFIALSPDTLKALQSPKSILTGSDYKTYSAPVAKQPPATINTPTASSTGPGYSITWQDGEPDSGAVPEEILEATLHHLLHLQTEKLGRPQDKVLIFHLTQALRAASIAEELKHNPKTQPPPSTKD